MRTAPVVRLTVTVRRESPRDRTSIARGRTDRSLMAVTVTATAVPTLRVRLDPDGRVRLTWPAAPGYRLESTVVLQSGAAWSPANPGQEIVLPASETPRYFRLHH